MNFQQLMEAGYIEKIETTLSNEEGLVYSIDLAFYNSSICRVNIMVPVECSLDNAVKIMNTLVEMDREAEAKQEAEDAEHHRECELYKEAPEVSDATTTTAE